MNSIEKTSLAFVTQEVADSGEHSSGTLPIAVIGLIAPAFLGLSVWHMSTGRLQGHIQEESGPSSSVGRCQIGEASRPHRHICDSYRGLTAFPESRPHCLPPEVTFSTIYHHTYQGKYPLFQALGKYSLFSFLKFGVGWKSKRPVGNSRGDQECPTPP